MSEEILKALMQLFAIVAKQESGGESHHREYVLMFLKLQLSHDKIEEYISLYDGFVGADEGKEKKGLVSVKDSVKTLGICKKINKTLTQKQKIVVLVRLYEFIRIDYALSSLRTELLETVSTVFNIEKQERESIFQFVFNMGNNLSENKQIYIHHPHKELQQEFLIADENQLFFLKIDSVDLYFLRYDGESEILLNGQVVNKKYIYLFPYGSTVKPTVGEAIYYSDVAGYFLSEHSKVELSFEAEKIYFRFNKQKPALQNINIAEGPGKLIAIMGASGAGKTTLLNVLAGLEQPVSGSVCINGIDIYQQKNKIQGVIGYIPQDDILLEELTVFENLYYNAKLCFAGIKKPELIQKVEKTLSSLGLLEVKDVKVGNVLNKKISGGQRKRLNIALELIREPSILFVDEPTSGLSSRDSENVIDLLKELALKGKLIFTVIHQPSSDIYKMFDKVIVLDTGGYQVYYGNPIQAVIHFKTLANQINSDKGQCYECGNVNPEQIFAIVEAKVVDEYGQETHNRKFKPAEWYEYFIKTFKKENIQKYTSIPQNTLKIPNLIKQGYIFIQRDVLSKLSNKQYLLINFLEAPVLAFVLAFIIRYIENPESGEYVYRENENIPAYLFMSIIVALFMGLTVSAEEIIRDRKLLKRESFLNLSWGSYIFSKLVILFSLSAIQTFTFVLIGNTLLGIKGMYFDYWYILFAVSCFANVTGLNISSGFNSAVTIYILIPLLLIPQMILSGAIFGFDKLNKLIGSRDKVPVVADLMPSRWAFEALAINQFSENKYQKPLYELEKEESTYDYRLAYLLPNLDDRISECLRFKTRPEKKQQVENNIRIVKNELLKEYEITKAFNPESVKKLDIHNFDKATSEQLKDVVAELKDYYTKKFNDVNDRKDMYISNNMATEADEKAYMKLKNEYYNESLADLVRKTDAKKPFIEIKNELIRQKDPVYYVRSSENGLSYRTHFFAPLKTIFGNQYPTYKFNLCVIWAISLLLVVCLYFEVLLKLISIKKKLN